MRTITLEEHYASPEFLAGPGQHLAAGGAMAGVLEALCDVDERRIAAMDEAGIDVQVLSLTSPGTEQLAAPEAVELARRSNDFLAAAVRRHPDRFAAFAALPTADPAAAADELARTVAEHGFRGALIHGHVRGRYLDDPFFAPILERAQELAVPIYLHPTPPPQAVIDASYKGFPPLVETLLAGPAWGWHIETAVHVIRLILGGVFDRLPRLQVMVGHLGEGLPSMLPRLDLVLSSARTGLARPFAAYLRENVHYTIAGFNFTSTFLGLLLEVGAERILFSADHPYNSMAQARAFLDRLPVSSADRERIAHGNAERLLGL